MSRNLSIYDKKLEDSRPAVGLIPARAGSKRVPDKNITIVKGHPLLAYTIASALESKMFERVIVSTDSELYAEIAVHYGAEVPLLRPNYLALDHSTDFEWVEHLLTERPGLVRDFVVFSILRPTSPLRSASTIIRAFHEFYSEEGFDSLRAVEPCSQHPGKMWCIRGGLLVPILPVQPSGTEWFSSPTQTLPEVWIQNASLEISYVRCVTEDKSISGNKIKAFKTDLSERVDINYDRDFNELQQRVLAEPDLLPVVPQRPFF